MRKIITFLGKYPKETWYEFEGQRYRGEVFAQALHQFVPYDQMLVFVTQEARETAWPVLAALNDDRIQPVDIEIGKTPEEMWALFDKILAHIEEGGS